MDSTTEQEEHDASRRSLMKKAVVAGAVVWTAPVVMSAPAAFAAGSVPITPPQETAAARGHQPGAHRGSASMSSDRPTPCPPPSWANNGANLATTATPTNGPSDPARPRSRATRSSTPTPVPVSGGRSTSAPRRRSPRSCSTTASTAGTRPGPEHPPVHRRQRSRRHPRHHRQLEHASPSGRSRCPSAATSFELVNGGDELLPPRRSRGLGALTPPPASAGNQKNARAPSSRALPGSSVASGTWARQPPAGRSRPERAGAPPDEQLSPGRAARPAPIGHDAPSTAPPPRREHTALR